MKVRTLIILSVLFFAIGSLGGAAYAFVSGNSVLAPVASILPTPKTPEEKMIDNFIETQEKKQQTETKQPDSAQKDDGSDDNQASQPKTAPTDEETKKQEPADTSKNTEKRMGQPTVSDGKTLRVRQSPDAKNGEVLIGIPNTEKVEIVDEKNGWYQIITSNGTKGWVSKEYMKEL